jgi:acyl carrier protein
MQIQRDIIAILDEVLGLNGRASRFRREIPLLGALPGLDSMAAMTLVATIEGHFGITVADAELNGSTFADVGSLSDYVRSKLHSQGAAPA